MTTMIADQKQDAPAPADSTTVDQTGTEAPVCTPPVLASTQAAGDALNDLTRDQERLLRRGGELDRTIPRLEREEQEAGAEAKAIDRGTPPGRKEAVEKRVAATRRELENARQEREAIKEGLSSLTTQIRDTEATAKQLIEACNDPKAVDRHAAGIRKDLARKQKALATQRFQLEMTIVERVELSGVASSIEAFCTKVRPMLGHATFAQRRQLVELLIDRVVVTQNRVEIRYVIPTQSNGPPVPFCHLRTNYR